MYFMLVLAAGFFQKICRHLDADERPRAEKENAR
jgi:hypothetical protein